MNGLRKTTAGGARAACRRSLLTLAAG